MGKDKKKSLFLRKQSSGSKLSEVEDGRNASFQETYQSLGKLNPKHLRNADAWNIKYLGCVQNITDWQSSSSRSEFMEIIDKGQAEGRVMWESADIKQLHVSPQWLLVTDKGKKLVFVELPMATVGSLSYAEDENRHYLGIKAAVVDKAGQSQLCCYVLEGDNESMIRKICSRINEIFQLLLSHQQAKEREEETQQEPGVRPVMLHRLSTPQGLSSSPTHGEILGKETDELDYGGKNSRSTSTNEYLQDQIDKQFSVMSAPTSPEATQPSLEPIQQPRIHRITREEAIKKATPLTKPLPTRSVDEDDDDDDDIPLMVSPLQIGKVSYHDGMVHRQALEDTTGVVVPDRLDILVPKGKTRPSVETFWDSSDDQAVPMTPLTHLPSPGHHSNPKSPSPSQSDHLALRIERDRETEIDGYDREPVLVQTVTGEKETAIMGTPDQVELLHNDQIDAFLLSLSQKMVTSPPLYTPRLGAPLPPPPPPPGSGAPPPQGPGVPAPPLSPPSGPGVSSPPATGTIPPPPPLSPGTLPSEVPVKRLREPWKRLIGPNDEPQDTDQRNYLRQVKEETGELEYRRLRMDWVEYQKCNLDVFGFTKKMKLVLRGDRVYLQIPGKVLVDKEDQSTYVDILEGRLPTIRSIVQIPATASQKPADHSPRSESPRSELKSEVLPGGKKEVIKPSDIKKWSQNSETHIEDVNENKKRPLVSRLKSKLLVFERGHQDEEQSGGSSKKDRATTRKDREEDRRGKQRDNKSKKEVENEEEEESETEEEYRKRKKREKKKRKEKKKKEMEMKEKKKKEKEKKKKQDERDKKQRKKVEGISDILSAGNQVLSEKDDFTHTLDALSDLIGEEPENTTTTGDDALDSIIAQTMNLASSEPTTKPISPTKKNMSLAQADSSMTHQTSSSNLFHGRRLKQNQPYQNIPFREDQHVSHRPAAPQTTRPSVQQSYISSSMPPPPPPMVPRPLLPPQVHVQAHNQGLLLPPSVQTTSFPVLNRPAALQPPPNLIPPLSQQPPLMYPATSSQYLGLPQQPVPLSPVMQQPQSLAQPYFPPQPPSQPVPQHQPILQQQPIAQQPLAQQQPIVQHPFAQQQPTVQQPLAQQQPTVQQPLAQQQPTVQQPLAQQQPVVQQPLAQQQPTVQQPLAQQQPIVQQQPVAQQPTTQQQLVARPTVQQSEPPLQHLPQFVSSGEPVVQQTSQIVLQPLSTEEAGIHPTTQEPHTTQGQQQPTQKETSLVHPATDSMPTVAPITPTKEEFLFTEETDSGLSFSLPMATGSANLPPVNQDSPPPPPPPPPLSTAGVQTPKEMSTAPSHTREELTGASPSAIAIAPAPPPPPPPPPPLLPILNTEQGTSTLSPTAGSGPLPSSDQNETQKVTHKPSSANAPPRLPPTSPSSSPVHVKRNNLLDEIKRGRNLRKVESPKEGRRGALLAQTDDGKELTKVALEEKGRRKSATMEEIPILANATHVRGDKMKRESREEEGDRKVSTSSRDDNFEEDKRKEHISRSPMVERVEEVTKQEDDKGEVKKRKSSEQMKTKKSVVFDDVVTDISEGEATKRSSTISEGYGGSRRNSLVSERLSEFTKQIQEAENSKQNSSNLSRASSSESINEGVVLRAERKRGHSRTPSSSSFVPPTHSIAEESENESDKAEGSEEEKPLPAWKRALMERRQKKEEKEESDQEEMSEPVKVVGEDGKPLPAWKAAMFAKRQEIDELEKQKKERQKALEESKFEGVPAWKRKIMEKKFKEKEVKEKKQLEKDQEMEDKLNEIRSMPQWKRDIFLQKNPEYVDKV